MLKFKFNYQNNTLAYQKHDLWYQVPEENHFEANFGSTDFWIPEKVIYYRKDLPKEYPLLFTFTATDQVEKLNGKWVKKGGNHE